MGTARTHPGRSSRKRAPRPSGRSDVVSGHWAVMADRSEKADGSRNAGRSRAGKIEDGRSEGRNKERAGAERAAIVKAIKLVVGWRC